MKGNFADVTIVFVFLLKGLECCSDSAISFHYVKPEQMYLLDYLIYQLKPFGLQSDNRPVTPEPPPDVDLTATPWFVTDQQEGNATAGQIIASS